MMHFAEHFPITVLWKNTRFNYVLFIEKRGKLTAHCVTAGSTARFQTECWLVPCLISRAESVQRLTAALGKGTVKLCHGRWRPAIPVSFPICPWTGLPEEQSRPGTLQGSECGCSPDRLLEAEEKLTSGWLSIQWFSGALPLHCCCFTSKPLWRSVVLQLEWEWVFLKKIALSLKRSESLINPMGRAI